MPCLLALGSRAASATALTLCLHAALPAQAPTHTSGSMVGSLLQDAAIVWTRASREAKVSVLHGTDPRLVGAIETPQVLATASTDFTAKIALDGLQPGTEYWYATRLEDAHGAPGHELSPIGRFKTPPSSTTDAPVDIAFSGDVYDPAGFGLFDLIRQQGNDLYLSLGDYTYCDPSTTADEYRAVHKAVRSFPSVVDFFRSTGAECIWDDHEIENDWNGATNPLKVQNGKAVWFEYFPMPQGATEVHRTLRWGKGVEVFLLDARSHRGVASDPDTPNKSMLGAAQRAWLEAALVASNARFKVIVSSMPLRYGHGITDSWWYAQNERKALFEFVNSRRIRNVVFLTADNHYMALHHHREGFREYMVGPVAQFVGGTLPNLDPEVRETRFERNWGRLRYDPAAGTLAVEVHGASGRIHTSVLRDETPATVRVQTDVPEASWSSSGPFLLRNSGLDVTSPRVEAGSYAFAFAPLGAALGRPLPITVDVTPGADVRVATAYRDRPDPNPLLFADAFEGPLTRYTIVDAGKNGLPPSWYVDGGYLWQGSNVSDNHPLVQVGTQAVFGSPTWADVTLSVRARSFDDDVFGAAFRWVDKDNYYAVVFDAERLARRLIAVQGGVVNVLATDPSAYLAHTWYAVRVVAIGSRLRVFVDDQLLFDVTDSSFASGRCALLTGSNLLTSFDDLVVRQGDAAATTPSWLLKDDFAANSLAAWTVLDEGSVSAPSAWSIDQGVCRQRANIHTPEVPPYDLARPGTLLLRGASTWTDYHFALAMRNQDDDGFGFVFRYVDASNHYRFSWDAQRALRRLVKVVGGVWSVLREDAVPFELGRWYRPTVELSGTRIRIAIDGVAWADLVDPAHPAGAIGLYTWRSDDVAFDDVEVTPLAPARATAAATVGKTTLLRIRTDQLAGSPYLLALSLATGPGIPLAALNSGDPRIWPLAADALFFTSLQPTPLLQGFQGLLPATGSIEARLDLPVLPVVAGTPFHLGGIVMNPSATRVLALLPSIELVFPR